MPVVIFFTCLDLEQKSSFMDGHYSNMQKALVSVPGSEVQVLILKTVLDSRKIVD